MACSILITFQLNWKFCSDNSILNLIEIFVRTGPQDERGDDGPREGDRDRQEEVGGHGEPQQGPQQREERPHPGDFKFVGLVKKMSSKWELRLQDI